jgi:Fe-S-cluster-containing dehydrogenase component/anaerobic selenocysteine-containing dehydrogenase
METKDHVKTQLKEAVSSERNTLPRHWVDMEELTEGYWQDEKAQSQRDQEFFSRPMDTLGMLEKKGMKRRDFFTVMGASMAMATMACARRPVNKIIPYVIQPEEITLGVPQWYASTCRECSAGCGILTKNREGRPIKLEGNPEHPVNRGSLCASGQASVLNLYDPDRLNHPLRITQRGSAESAQKASWGDLDAEITARLAGFRSGRVRVLTAEMTGNSSRRLVEEFLGAFANGRHIEHSANHSSSLSQAQNLSYGTSVCPTYRFDQAEVVVSFSSDFLSTGSSPVEYAKDWVQRRKLNSAQHAEETMSRFIAFEAQLSLTGSNADERFMVRPGEETKVALALAHEIIVERGLSPFAQQARVQQVLEAYSIEGVVSQLGGDPVSADRLRELASQLWEARGKSLVVAGSPQAETKNALSLQVAVNLLNSALGNEGQTIDGVSTAREDRSHFGNMLSLIREMEAGQVDALIIHGVNPLYSLPEVLGFQRALQNVNLVINISDRLEETSVHSDYVLAGHHYLENWGDAQSRKNLLSVQQPAIAPLFDTRSFEEVLLSWTIAGLSSTGLAARIATEDAGSEGSIWYHYLRANWRDRVYPRFGVGQGFDRFWIDSLHQGVVTESPGRVTARNFRPGALDVLQDVQNPEGNLQLVVYQKAALGDGANANNAWLQEMPDPLTTVTWDNYLTVSPALADQMKLRSDDVVEVKTAGHRIEVPVYVLPGQQANTVGLALGYGRERAGKVGTGVGKNAYAFVTLENESLVFSGHPVQIKKTGMRYQLAMTQGHHRTKNRPIVNDITLGEFQEDPSAEMHTNPHLRVANLPSIWPKHSYPGHRWGMSIDLNSCTGCGACVVACQAENNVPVVGRDQVRMGRNMHWLRIDRYFSGPKEDPDLIYQPMLCQHCENAPCETVCPVLATVSNSEGINEMVYSRCVGTRYCQNNCPYKVRRFNFFDHWKEYRKTKNLVWNPDVTVRSRGIMEKCTFCIQRIQSARSTAKDGGETKIPVDSFQTACQQTCPTNAITFGDINHPESAVAQQKKDARTFRVIEEVNTQPVVSYLTKVRNKEKGATGHDH